MNNLIFSQNNSIEPNGAIGRQKSGIVFWQKTGFLRHCNRLGFQSIITLINKNFSPSNIQNNGDTCFIEFDNDNNKIIYISLKKEQKSNHYYIYGESHTAYADAEFHLFALEVVRYISKQIGCKFFVDDATRYLEHHSFEELKEYIDSFKMQSLGSPDLFRRVIIEKNKE